MKNSFVYTVIFTFVLCFLFVLLLSFANTMTKDKIDENRRIEKSRAILSALGIQASTLEEIDSKFSNVVSEEIKGRTYYSIPVSGGKLYATNYTGPALWGSISGYIATNENVTKIVGFSITDQSETPGLGARISEDWFLEQLKGEAIVNDNITVLNGGTGDIDKDNGAIDGVTGATRTSDGIQGILTKAIKQFQKDLR